MTSGDETTTPTKTERGEDMGGDEAPKEIRELFGGFQLDIFLLVFASPTVDPLFQILCSPIRVSLPCVISVQLVYLVLLLFSVN